MDKILWKRTRSYRNSMESLSLLEMILEYYKEDHVKSYWIIQYPREYYKIVQDPIGWGWDLRQAWKDSTRLCKILNSGIIQDPTRSHRIPEQNPTKWLIILVKMLLDLREDFERLKSILSILPKKSSSTLKKILHYYRQTHMKFYRILENSIRSYRMVHKILWNRQQF